MGVGKPLSTSQVRMLELLRINTLAKGRSGISEPNLHKYILAFNKGFTPMIPEKGTVGASGDLAPLAHLALGMIGEGTAWCSQTASYVPASLIMERLGIHPIKLEEKEGLALINGTQFMSSLTSQALQKAKVAVSLFRVLVAFSFEVFALDGSIFDAEYIQLQKSPEMKRVLKTLGEMVMPKSELHSARENTLKHKHRPTSLVQSINCLAACLETLSKVERIVYE